MIISNYGVSYVKYDALNHRYDILSHAGPQVDNGRRFYTISLADAYISTFKQEHFQGLARILNELRDDAKSRNKI